MVSRRGRVRSELRGIGAWRPPRALVLPGTPPARSAVPGQGTAVTEAAISTARARLMSPSRRSVVSAVLPDQGVPGEPRGLGAARPVGVEHDDAVRLVEPQRRRAGDRRELDAARRLGERVVQAAVELVQPHGAVASRWSSSSTAAGGPATPRRRPADRALRAPRVRRPPAPRPPRESVELLDGGCRRTPSAGRGEGRAAR